MCESVSMRSFLGMEKCKGMIRHVWLITSSLIQSDAGVVERMLVSYERTQTVEAAFIPVTQFYEATSIDSLVRSQDELAAMPH